MVGNRRLGPSPLSSLTYLHSWSRHTHRLHQNQSQSNNFILSTTSHNSKFITFKLPWNFLITSSSQIYMDFPKDLISLNILNILQSSDTDVRTKLTQEYLFFCFHHQLRAKFELICQKTNPCWLSGVDWTITINHIYKENFSLFYVAFFSAAF